ncbi:DNA polymerase Y family protein [Aquabacterium sp.]|uniref:Y-family DNA polymerase n=1 Tax=Aquabacterium sp. TaxID=1872578 RepID=UPI0024885DEE|nr:DNA polymerase Y family protein [Aquabacterium sp.]MDI1348144.1 DNA polymerase Y family protein [Aquabacterium sp.]
MWHWIALLPHSAPEPEAAATDLPSLQRQLGWWALQFTPRVACLENAVVLEVAASERLFGGAQALRKRIQQGARQMASAQGEVDLRSAHAPTALGALALARAVDHEAPCTLDRLPLQTLSAVARHASTLAQLGCRTLGDVRALPRGGLSRRFGAALLQALDQAWGEQPEAFEWLTLPPTFDVQLELPARTDTTARLQPAFAHLLRALCAWMGGHQAGTEELVLRWCHEWSRQGQARWQGWPVRLASPVCDVTRLDRLVGEHLQRITLAAPVTDIGLQVHTLVPRLPDSAELFPSDPTTALDNPSAAGSPAAQRAQHEAWLTLLERLSVRLGPERVQQARRCADHRLSQSQRWVPALSVVSAARRPGLDPVATMPGDIPQPTWLLPEPLPLALDTRSGPREQPLYQGPLQLLAGPHRIEAGWWDTRDSAAAEARDHYLASSPGAGLLWVFRTRHAPPDARSAWFLLGFFA